MNSISLAMLELTSLLELTSNKAILRIKVPVRLRHYYIAHKRGCVFFFETSIDHVIYIGFRGLDHELVSSRQRNLKSYKHLKE